MTITETACYTDGTTGERDLPPKSEVTLAAEPASFQGELYALGIVFGHFAPGQPERTVVVMEPDPKTQQDRVQIGDKIYTGEQINHARIRGTPVDISRPNVVFVAIASTPNPNPARRIRKSVNRRM